jgi:hypothetical protein
MVVLAAAALNDSAEAIVTWHSEVADTGQQRVFDYMTKPLWELPRSGWWSMQSGDGSDKPMTTHRKSTFSMGTPKENELRVQCINPGNDVVDCLFW